MLACHAGLKRDGNFSACHIDDALFVNLDKLERQMELLAIARDPPLLIFARGTATKPLPVRPYQVPQNAPHHVGSFGAHEHAVENAGADARALNQLL